MITGDLINLYNIRQFETQKFRNNMYIYRLTVSCVETWWSARRNTEIMPILLQDKEKSLSRFLSNFYLDQWAKLYRYWLKEYFRISTSTEFGDGYVVRCWRYSKNVEECKIFVFYREMFVYNLHTYVCKFSQFHGAFCHQK